MDEILDRTLENSLWKRLCTSLKGDCVIIIIIIIIIIIMTTPPPPINSLHAVCIYEKQCLSVRPIILVKYALCSC